MAMGSTIKPGRTLMRWGWMMGALSLGMLAFAPVGWAREGDTQALIFIGTTRFASDDATSYGTTFGASFGYEVIDDLLWSVAVAATTTDGTATVDNKTYDIFARTTTLSTGPTYYFNRAPGSLVIPFVGAGLSVLNYDVDYDFPGSQLGKTSGTGAGGYTLAGVELWLSRTITLIAQYTLAAHEVETQDGKRVTLRSGGLGLSVRIGIRM
jgi:hypothetical protein